MTESARTLSLLRAMVDATDRDLLQAVARRMGLVREIAEVKRAAGLRIRDLQREQEVLDRGVAAVELPHRPDRRAHLTKSIWRPVASPNELEAGA